MSLSQFINKLNNKRINNQLKVVQKYLELNVNCKLLIMIYDEGLHIYDEAKNMLIVDLNVIQ